MTIEFYCSECKRLLRVGEEAGGKRARCPDCGNIQNVPLATDAAQERQSKPVEQPGQPASSNPFAGDGANPFAEPSRGDNNPFSTPTSLARGTGYLGRNVAIAKVRGPSIGITVIAVIMLAIWGLYLIGLTVAIAVGEGDEDIIFAFVMLLIAIVFHGLALVGASKMKKLKNYSLAMTGAILMVIPCSPCVVISMPFGIWALVVLFDPQVKGAFS